MIYTILIFISVMLFILVGSNVLSNNKLKKENKDLNKRNEELNKRNEELNGLLTPELLDVDKRRKHIEELNNKRIQICRDLENDKTKICRELEDKKYKLNKEIEELNNNINRLNKDCVDVYDEIVKKKEELVILNDELLLQDFGLYEPKYDFENSIVYKERLDKIRDKQKKMVRGKTAVSYPLNWTVDGSLAKGKKMTEDNVKQILRSFNTECESVISKVKFNNFENMEKRIKKSFDSLNKLNKVMNISIKPYYLQLKIEELHLAYEYQLKKQEEKEEQKRINEQLREQAKAQKELEEAKKKLDKEKQHYNNALDKINEQLKNNLKEEQKQNLLNKQEELLNKIEELNKDIEDVDYRQANQKAGYVYVISNIGSFGENVYKIGMTRRLEPQERIDELGGASVPFKFDVHAMIFTEDAPALENALHKAFDDKKVNMVNRRKEFFNVTLDEIEEVVKANFDKTVEFTRVPQAEQYRESLKIKNMLTN